MTEGGLCLSGQSFRVGETTGAEVGENKAPGRGVAGGPTCVGRGGVAQGMRPLRFGFQAVDFVDD